MKHSFASVLCLWVGSVWAAPNPLASSSSVCNKADNCYRAVKASAAAPGPASAIRDCSSFMVATVIPCPSTTTATFYTTVSTDPVASTIYEGTVVTYTAATETETSTLTTTTMFNTLTETVPFVVSETSTITQSVTVTAGADQKRRRGASTCPIVTAAASQVPAYASLCSGRVRYSSACSCVGITATTITAVPMTVTVNTTITSTVTPSLLTTEVSTSTQDVTVTETATQFTDFQTTDATVTVSAIATTAVTVTATNTVTVTPSASACPSTATTFIIQVQGSLGQNGSYLTKSLDITGFTKNVTLATTYTIDAAGHVMMGNTGLLWSYTTKATTSLEYIRLRMPSEFQNFAPLTCSIASGPIAPFSGPLTCTSAIQGYTDIIVRSTTDSYPIMASAGQAVKYSPISLIAIPVC